jgi:hypothetical protein
VPTPPPPELLAPPVLELPSPNGSNAAATVRFAPLPDEDRRRKGQLYMKILAGAGVLLAALVIWRMLRVLW